MLFHSKKSDIYFISREGNIIYENLKDGTKIPIYRLKQIFPNIPIMNEIHINYMSRYIEMFPELVERIEINTVEQQLSLF